MPPSSKSVLITGASSDIGRACVVQMNRAEWRIFATVRKPADANRLHSEFTEGVTPILMDVEDRSSIAAAAAQVAAQCEKGLHGLVNVAGIGLVQSIEYASRDDLHRIFEINFFGQIDVIQAFLPLLRNTRGRILNIFSVGAHIAIPFGGLLNATKSAFGIVSDTLRLELHPFGVRVITIEPGAISTPAVEKTLGDVEKLIAKLPETGRARYGAMLRSVTRRGLEREKNGSAPEVVARAVHHALTAKRPKIRYRVGKDARLLTTLPRILPDSLLDKLRLRALGLPTEFDAISDTTHNKLDRAA